MKLLVVLLFSTAILSHAQVCQIPRPDAKPDGMVYSPSVIAEFKNRVEGSQAVAPDLYLYGKVLIGTNTPEAIKVLNQTLAADSGYAPAHLALVEIYKAPNFLDPAKALTHLEAWMKACPDQFEGFRYLERMNNTAFVRENVTHMRELVDKADDSVAATNVRVLWTLEFQVHPPTEFALVKERIAKDLERLRKLDLNGNPALAATLREGYKLVDDKDGTAWVNANSPVRTNLPASNAPASNAPASNAPASNAPASNAPMEAFQEWQKTHPFVTLKTNPTDFAEANRERNKLLLAATAEWVAKWPDNEFAWTQRLQSVRSNREVSDVEVERISEAFLKACEAQNKRFSSPYFALISIYLQRNMHVAELPDMVKKGLADMDSGPASRSMISDLYQSPRMEFIRVSNKITGWDTLADVYLQAGKLDLAADSLANIRKLLESVKPAANAETMDKQMWGQRDAQYWDKRAQIAEKKGVKADALAYYQKEISATSFGMQNRYLLQKAKTLWTDLGGSEEGWSAWSVGSPDSAKPVVMANIAEGRWQELDRPLPEFEIVDMAGKTWHLADLKGRTTLINLWATWCGPCVQELPELQKLYDQIKDRPDIRLITLNTDDNAGLIEPFMKDKHYTFPVLPAREYIAQLVPSLSIPRNWIVNNQAVLKLETIGFGVGDGKWTDHMKDKIETFAKTK